MSVPWWDGHVDRLDLTDALVVMVVAVVAVVEGGARSGGRGWVIIRTDAPLCPVRPKLTAVGMVVGNSGGVCAGGVGCGGGGSWKILPAFDIMYGNLPVWDASMEDLFVVC